MAIEYLDNALISAAIRTKTPACRSVTGYGSKLPTSYMIKLDNHIWYRIYCMCYSNNGSIYIRSHSKTLFIRDESRISALVKQAQRLEFYNGNI